MILNISEHAWEEYLYWQKVEKKLLKNQWIN